MVCFSYPYTPRGSRELLQVSHVMRLGVFSLCSYILGVDTYMIGDNHSNSSPRYVEPKASGATAPDTKADIARLTDLLRAKRRILAEMERLTRDDGTYYWERRAYLAERAERAACDLAQWDSEYENASGIVEQAIHEIGILERQLVLRRNAADIARLVALQEKINNFTGREANNGKTE